MTRKDDLEHAIRESYEIIREYESTIQTSDHPEEKIRARREIDRQWTLIKGYLDEYRALTGDVLPDDIAQIAAHFGALGNASQVAPPPPPVPQQRGKVAWQTYKDFVLKLGHADEGTYSVEAQGPTGEAKTTFELPFGDKDLQIFVLQVGRPRRTTIRGRVPEPMQQTVDFGGQLYNAVLSGAVRDTFVSARHEAQREGYGLRVKLRITDAPELADLPWEFLYDGHDFLALSSDTPVVRYLDLPRPPRPMGVDLPLRVLVTISSPQDLDPVDAEQERKSVCEALAGMEAQGMLTIDFLTDVTLSAFNHTLSQAKFNGSPYHVWHHIGHGSYDPNTQTSALLFSDRSGRSVAVSGFQLGTVLNGHPEMRLAMLNSCEGARVDRQDPFGGVAAALVERGIPAVIGMQFEISNEAAIIFAQEFYTVLAEGLPVDVALTEARLAVFSLPNWVEWAMPVLYMRSPNGRLFDVQKQVGTEREGEKAVKAQERAQAERQEREEDERKARETAERQTAKETQHREEAENKARKEAPPAVLATAQPFEPAMILIPAGEFLMGSDTKKDKGAYLREQPRHALCLPDFYIARAPVTNAQYQAYVQATGQSPPEHWKRKKPAEGEDDHPIVNVSWHDAIAYCRWLAKVTGRPYLLPSEAEWEKAARGTNGRIFPWSNEWNLCQCNTRESEIADTTPVGEYPQGASPYGCLDMAGNVWEWTRSLWGKERGEPEFRYPYDPTDGRENLDADDGVSRVIRGGSFSDSWFYARTSYRGKYDAGYHYGNLGLRVVISPISISDL